MMNSPKSLTATVHIRFNYDGPEAKPVEESQVEMINRILDGAADLDPTLRDLLISFVAHLSEVSNQNNGGRTEPE